MPHQAARDADLRRGHEIRHVALERTLREVRAELQERDEHRDGNGSFDVAIATRNTTSSTEPMKMYGLRRPHRLIV